MYYDEGDKKLTDKVAVSKEELEDLNYIKKHVDKIYIQDTPDSPKEKF